MNSTLLKSVSPLNLEKIGQRHETSLEEVKQICLKARESSRIWKNLPFKQKQHCFLKLRKILFQNRNELALAITREVGKPILQSYMAEIYPMLSNLKYLIKKAPAWLSGREVIPPLSVNAKISTVEYVPYGVIGIIGTWNYPVLLNFSSIFEALIAGNSVVFKPSENAWMVAERFQSLFDQAGFPEGVFQTVYGGAETGQAITEASLDKFFFTGSVEVGRKIHEQLARNGIPCVLELSGNDPMIVCKDSSISLAVKAAVWGSMLNSGQNCIGIKRILVNNKIYSSFKARIVSEIKKLKIGPGESWKTDIGPLRRETELLRCEALIENAKKHQAKILIGGKRAPQDQPGHFFQPTLIETDKYELDLWNVDYFGPIALLTTFEDEEEAVEKANQSQFGLGAAVFSKNLKKAKAMASKLECGMVTVNDVLWPVSLPMFPFGGIKKSGFGRNRGLDGLREMVYPKSVFIKTLNDRFRPYYFQPYNKWTPKIAEWVKWFYK